MPVSAGSPAFDGTRTVLSIVLATLNERENLPAVLAEIRQQPLPPFEAIVVDDGSTDGTREWLRTEAVTDPRIRPIFHEGKQTTLRAQGQGIRASVGRWVVVMDADRQHPASVLPSMLAELRAGASLVVASRYVPGGTPGSRTFGRAILSRGAEWTAKLVLRDARGVSDPVSGFFAFRRDVFEPLDPEDRGYKLLLFLLVMAHGRPIREVPFRFEPRAEGASKVTSSSAFLRVFLAEVAQAKRLERRRARRSSAP